MDLDDDINLDKNKKHNIEVVIDRIVMKEGLQQDLAIHWNLHFDLQMVEY